MKNNKGFMGIGIIVVIIVVLAVSGIAYYFGTKNSSVSENNVINKNVVSNQAFPESEVLASLKINWKNVQDQVLNPKLSNSNSIQEAQNIFTAPTDVQFIGNNNLLIRIHDLEFDHNAVFNFDGNKFNLLEDAWKEGGGTTLLPVSVYKNLINKYGNPSYIVSSYTTEAGMGKNKFPELTKVSENYFVKN